MQLLQKRCARAFSTHWLPPFQKVSQATYTGLTSLLISSMKCELPDFPLEAFAASVGELAAVTTALDKVGNHSYFMHYSSQNEKNKVKSTGYKNTSYLSMRLLIKVLGKSSESYAGQENYTGLRHKTKADVWIKSVLTKRRENKAEFPGMLSVSEQSLTFNGKKPLDY